jgi:RNA polymerase sigma-70 factor (ECF subfamily)
MLSPDRIERYYREHGGEVLGYFARRCPGEAAHDLLQETFLQVARQGERLETVAMPRAWLFGIARHVLARYAKLRLSRTDESREFPLAGEEMPEESSEDARLEAVREAMASLPEELRETLELRLEQELSYEEIAGVLEIPIGTVRSRLHSAVRRLRAMLLPPDPIL